MCNDYSFSIKNKFQNNFSINYYKLLNVLTKCFTNLEKRYPHFLLFAFKSLKAQFIFFILYKKELSQDLPKASLARCTNNPPNYNTE